MHIFHILFTSFVHKISTYDNNNTTHNFVELISSNDYKLQTQTNHFFGIHNGIIVMDNIYFYYNAYKFDLYLSLHNFETNSYRRIEIYDELTAAFFKFIHNLRNKKKMEVTYEEFKNRFFDFLHKKRYKTEKFSKKQFLNLTKKMFGLDKDCTIDDKFLIDHELIKQTIKENRHIFIDCNLLNLDQETFISLVQIYKDTNKYVRLTPYYLVSNDLIYKHHLLNDVLAGNVSNDSNKYTDYLFLTNYRNKNKYFNEILHFVKMSEKTIREYVFQQPLQSFKRNSFGIIEQEVPKEIKVYNEFDTTN